MATLAPTDRLTILDNGLCLEDGLLLYAWFKLQRGPQVSFRCVAMKQLLTLPVEDREKYGALGKAHGAIRGLHNARVTFAYAAVGIFKPEHIGVVQLYGAANEATTEEEAARGALSGLAAVMAAMANFEQSTFGPPDLRWFQWYLDFITASERWVGAMLGHPDPRKGERGNLMGDGKRMGGDDLALEQNEQLFRGLARLRQNFVWQILAENVERGRIIDTGVRLRQMASGIASRRKGSKTIGFSLGVPLMAALAQSAAAGQGVTASQAAGITDGVAQGWGETAMHSRAVTDGGAVAVTDSVADSITHSQGQGVTAGQSVSEMSGWASGGGSMMSDSQGWNVGLDVGDTGFGENIPLIGGLLQGVSGGYSQGSVMGQSSFASQSGGVANASMSGTSQMSGVAETHTVGQAVTRSSMHAETLAEGWGVGQNWGQQHAASQMTGQAQSANILRGLTAGMSSGLIPGISFQRGWQLEDHVAEQLTQLLGQFELLLDEAGADGGYMTNALMIVDTREGAQAADALIPQAFHGPDVPTPVLTVAPLPGDMDELRAHAFAFSPWNVADGDPLGGSLWTRYATLMTAQQVAALLTPAVFEEGVATTVMAPIPRGMAFYPDMPGDVVLGHQYSPETAQLTNAPVRLARANLMHTMFAGDTGFGKSVAAQRLAYEATLNWRTRTIVLDWGAGWRAMMNAPGLDGHVDVRQLQPDGVRPLRWNPLQIGRRIPAETQWRALADIFAGVTLLGVKRQKQEFLDALRQVYLRAGVLVEDPDIRRDPVLGKVGVDEALELDLSAGSMLGDLTAEQRQALAVFRSSKVGLLDLYRQVEKRRDSVPPRDTMLTGVLDGILYRMHSMVQGQSAAQYAPGTDTVPIEDMARPWGMVVIEGGKTLDELAQAFLLAWLGWHLYNDMVQRRLRSAFAGDEPPMIVVWEEANMIFRKDEGGSGEDSGGGISAMQRMADMFRDARKYLAYFLLITQAPHLIADDVVSSCSCLVASYLKQPKDKDLVLSALARSEKGFMDEPWRRFVNDMPVGMAIGRFPYTTERAAQRPMLFRPLMVDVPEPDNDQIAARLGRIDL